MGTKSRPRPEVGALIAAMICALGATQSAAAQEASKIGYSPELLQPHLVAVEGARRLNIVCQGKGSPTVVFEEGGEGNLLSWRKVQPAVAAKTRACVYDRAGFGWSDPATRPVTALNTTDDLHTLLKRAVVSGPLILVGHSMGGLYATVYADRFRRDVAGLVLVDPGTPGNVDFSAMDADTAEAWKIKIRTGEQGLLKCAALAKDGGLIRHPEPDCTVFPKARSPAEQAYYDHAMGSPAWWNAEFSQSRSIWAEQGENTDEREEKSVRRSFDSMPLIVFTADREVYDLPDNPVFRRAFSARWKRGHDELVARSTLGRAVVVPGASHFIQVDRPDVVIAAIEEEIALARAK